MPAGVSNPVIGYLGFCAVKFAGYSLAARFISRSYQRTDRSAFLVGGVRTLIGMAEGAAYYNIWRLIPDAAAAAGIGYLGGLLPVRLAEWWLLLWLFYDRQLQQRRKDWRTVALATVWSYALDVQAVVSPEEYGLLRQTLRRNQAAPGNGAMALLVQIQRLRRAVPEQYR